MTSGMLAILASCILSCPCQNLSTAAGTASYHVPCSEELAVEYSSSARDPI